MQCLMAPQAQFSQLNESYFAELLFHFIYSLVIFSCLPHMCISIHTVSYLLRTATSQPAHEPSHLEWSAVFLIKKIFLPSSKYSVTEMSSLKNNLP